MMQKTRQQPSGFSIVELLLYMGLFVGFLTILSAFFVATLEAQVDAVSTSHEDQDSWYILSRLQNDVYQATDVVTPAANGDESTELVLDMDGTEVTYSLVNNKLVITQDLETAQLLSENIMASNLSFERLGNDYTGSIIIHLDLLDNSGNQLRDLDFTVGLRP